MESFNMNDIYNIMNIALIEKDYNKSDLQTKISIINSSLVDYFAYKLLQLHIGKLLNDPKEQFKIICDTLKEDDLLTRLSPVIHFLLTIISGLQNFEVLWEIDNTVDKELPQLIKYNNKLDKLITCKKPDMSITFRVIYEYLNKIELNKENEVQLIKEK